MAIRPGLKIGRVLGIPIYIHSTWLFIFALITFSLAIATDALRYGIELEFLV